MNLKGRNLTQGLTGADVTELHNELIALGFTIPPAEQQAANFGQGTFTAVQQFQTKQGLPITGVVEATTAAELGQIIILSTYTVSGAITSPVSAGVGGLNVQLVAKNVGADINLTSGSTDRQGAYRLTVAISQAKPALQVRVSAGTNFLAASIVAYNAPLTVTLDVALPADAPGLPSEYETLTTNLLEFFSGKLSALKETEEQQDITVLANISGWDARPVAMAALADLFSGTSVPPPSATPANPTTSPIPPAPAAILAPGPAPLPVPPPPPVSLKPEFYYALFRAGLPANADSLFQASPKAVQAVWEQAIKQGVIPQSLSGEIAGAVQTFTTLSATHTLSAKPPIGISSMHDMLQASLTNATPQQEQQFANLYSQYHDDMPIFWSEVEKSFGATAAKQLQLHGQLFYLTLNNAPLVSALVSAERQIPLTSTLDLATRGYYSPDKWLPLIGNSIPPQIPGAGVQQQNNYAQLLATQVRLAYPTAVVADLVRNGTFPLSDKSVQATAVANFLTVNQGKFEIGIEPIKAYLTRTELNGTPTSVVNEITRFQRMYQLTLIDPQIAVLLQHNLDSAYSIARYDAAGFIRAYQAKLGGTDAAAKIHARAKQIHGAVLNMAIWYLGARIAPGIGSNSPIMRLDPPTEGTMAPSIGGNLPAVQLAAPASESSNPIIAYPTLEGLFGSLDFCTCRECRSILSPAAYLVDLLHYLDQLSPTQGYKNPQKVLFGRRPDIQYLPLTCENTNTALPYIDIVNETLEYFVVNNHSLAGYEGHDTGDGVASDELMASPQYVNDAAYTTLQKAYFPPPLPFNRPLEVLRLHLQKLGVALRDVMVALRKSDAIDSDSPTDYGWRDILMEQLGISRDEYRLFTDSSLGLHSLYGYPIKLNDPDPNSTVLTGFLQPITLQEFSRRTSVSYDDVFSIIKTQFVNPNSILISRIERLNASFATLQSLNDPDPAKAAANAAAFKNALPFGLDPRQYGGLTPTDDDAVVNWVKRNLPRITNIITITNPDPVSDVDQCSGNTLQFRYSNPVNTTNKLSATDFVKLIRFIRLWRKLGLSIGQTDELLLSLFPASDMPSGTNDAANLQLLDQGFVTFVSRAGFLFQVMRRLGLSADAALFQLLACWAPISTVGNDALYKRMVLTPTLLQDAGGQMAMIGAPISAGDVLTTTINTVEIPYTAQAGDTPATIATNIANTINGTSIIDPTINVPLNWRIHADVSGQPGVIVIRAGFTLACSVSIGATQTYTAGGPSPLQRTATVIGTTITPGDVLTTTINNVVILYSVAGGDTAITVAGHIASAINGTTAQDPFSGLPLNSLVLATSVSGVITINAINSGAPFALACSFSPSDTGSYDANPLTPPGWTATIGGVGVQAGDALITTINGVALPYTALARDTNTTILASSIAAMINGSTVTDPTSTLPVKNLVVASVEGSVITLTAKDPTIPFTLACSVSHGAETYTPNGPLPASQSVDVGGTFAANHVLFTTINGIGIPYPTIVGDTPVSIAANIATAINTTTTPDPAANLPVNSLVSAAAGPTQTSGGRTSRSVVVTAKDATTTFTMTVSLAIGSYTAGRQSSPFADDGYGNFLQDSSQTIFGHESALCAACNLTGAEFALIAQELKFDASTPLSLPNVSAIFRFGWLAHVLRMSVQEFLLLRQFSGLDPFASLDPGSPPATEPPVIHFIRLIQALAAGGLRPTQALYLMWNQDLSGKSAPQNKDITGLARTLRADFAAVEAQFALGADPDGTIAKGLMALVYGSAATDFFFGLLNNTLSVSIGYSNPPGQLTLPQPIIDASKSRLDYDDLRKQLTYTGVLGSATRAAIDQAVDQAVASNANYVPLRAAVAALATANQQAVDPFFSTYPELQPVYDAYVASSDPPAAKRTTLLANFLPSLKHKRKQEEALASVTAAAGTDQSFANALLQDATILHAADPTLAAIVDLTAIESQGLSMQLFLSNSPNGNPDKTLDFVPVSSRFQTASVGGTITVSDVLTTTINGIAIAYTVVGADLTLPILAEHVAAAINATTLSDPVTSLPLNQVVFASSSGNNITIATFNPNGVSSGFSLTYSTTAGATETYTAGGGTPVASIWSGYIDVPQDGFYNVSVTTDAAAVTLEIGGVEVFMAQNGNVWSNQNRISLTAGVLAPIVLTATSIRNSLSVSWSSSPGIGSQIIPGQYLYSATLVNRLQAAYVRFLKATSIATALSLTADEIAYLATSTNFRVNTDGRDKLVAGTNNIFTPASMNNIKTGIKLIIDTGSAQETVNVVNTTPTTFSAATTQPHDGTTTPFPIVSTTFPNVGQGWLNFLGASDTPDTTISAIGANLRGVLMALLAYARIKQALSPNDGRLRLLTTLKNPAAVLPNGKLALFSLTGWDQTSLNALMMRFFGNADVGNLGSVETLRRVYDAYAFVQTCRISAAALIAVTTNAPSATTIAALQSALRALYAESDWLTVVRPINDTMRIRQRDALVAYILQQLGDNYEQSLITSPTAAPANGGGTTLSFTSTANIKSGMQVQGANVLTYTTVMAVGTNTVTIGPGLLGDLPTGSNITFDPGTAPAINTADKLFEYFLLDVQTQPPVETSRIRLALSSVQLFIERILRNLEPQVSPSDIDGSLWPWMKRYRVWQANREVFLWPENWLYPELRDDQSPFFRETMSALLQSDITDDAAANAYLDYLTELEEVAKLEPCGLYYSPETNDANEISYVVARTAGAHRKYYFRTKENGSWTPWTEVKIDCEDMPLTPIVWNGRLFLFWLKILKQTSPQSPPANTTLGYPATSSNTPASSLSLDNLQSFAQAGVQAQLQNSITVNAVLCWSEFYNGKWQPTKTSDINRPTSLGTFPATGDQSFDVDRNLVRIVPAQMATGAPFDIPPEALILAIRDPIHALDSVGGGGFVLFNTHSLPVRIEAFIRIVRIRLPVPFGGGVVWTQKVRYLSQYLALPDRGRTLAPIQPYTGANAAGTFSISYWTGATGGSAYNNNLIGFNWIPRYIEPQPGLASAWDAPFFFEDRRNLFYVTTSETYETIRGFPGFGIISTSPSLQGTVVNIPPLVFQQQPKLSVKGDPILTGSGGGDGGPMTVQGYLSDSTNIRVGIGSVTLVPYQGRQISLTGSADADASTATPASERDASS